MRVLGSARVRVALLVMVAAALGAAAPPVASAGDVWLWACHGPAGQALTDLGDRVAADGDPEGSDCSTPGAATGLRAQAGTGWVFDLPSGATLSQVRVNRRLALGMGETYTLRADSVLENSPAADGDLTFAAAGARVAFDVACSAVCTPGEGATVSALAFRITDGAPPSGGVAGWRSPAAGTLQMEVQGVDAGLGLRSATVLIDGQPVGSARYGDPECSDLSPETGTVDLPFNLVAQNDILLPQPATPVGCIGRGKVSIPVDTTRVGDGDHRIAVDLTDVAGNTARVMDNATEIRNVIPATSNTRTLTVGSSGVNDPVARPGADAGGEGGVLGASATSCRAPRLSMVLADKPVRIAGGAPVLRYGRPYRFKGRLTCAINGQRRSAPKRLQVDVLNDERSKTTYKTGTTTGDGGDLAVVLTYTAARTILFRFVSAEGERSQVRIKIRVERLRTFPSKTAIRARWFRYETPSDRVRFAAIDGRNVLAGSTIRVRCRGAGCPSGSTRSSLTRRRRPSLSVLGKLAGATLLPGASVDVTISKRGYRGIGKLYCVRGGQKVQTKPYNLDGRHPSC